MKDPPPVSLPLTVSAAFSVNALWAGSCSGGCANKMIVQFYFSGLRTSMSRFFDDAQAPLILLFLDLLSAGRSSAAHVPV